MTTRGTNKSLDGDPLPAKKTPKKKEEEPAWTQGADGDPVRIWKGNPVLEQFLMPVSELKEDPENAREHDDRNLKTVKNSFATFGQQTPLVYSPVSKEVKKGNGSLRAVRELGWTHIAAIPTNLEQKVLRKAYAITDNRTSDLSKFNDEVLADALAMIKAEEEELERYTGFTLEEYEKLVAVEEPPEPDEQDPPGVKPQHTCPECGHQFS